MHILDRPRAKAVITGIFAVLASGGCIDRAFIVRRFKEGGYADHLANRYADTLIDRNTMTLPRLIGLYSPAPGCGKTTAANLFIHHQRVSFAAPLKRAVWNMLDDIGFEGFRYTYTDKEAIIPELGVSARHMMQTLGTEWGRACIHPDFWVMIARAETQRIVDNGGCVVIDDVRFPNEAAMIRDLGGELWRIDRPSIAYDGDHSSEGGLEDITPDRVIVNDGTIMQLKERLF